MQRFEEQIAAGLAEVEPRTRVYQAVLENLKSSGQLTNEVAAQHAALYAAHYQARAARNPGLYSDAYDAFEKAGTGKGVTVRSELPESIRALGKDRLEVMLDSIRSGRAPVKLPKERKEATPAVDATILKAARRLARGLTPEKAIKTPQSLTDFVRKNGGLNIAASEAGDIRAADLTKIPGLLQKKGKDKGKSADILAQAAMDAGFRFGPETQYGSGVDVDAFIKALEADATGRSKVYPDDADTAAFQAQQDYFNEFFRWLKDDLGWEPKGRTPQEIADFLSKDDTTQRLMVLAERVDAVGRDSPEAQELDAELARIKDESLQRLWEEYDERDAAMGGVDGGPSVPDTGSLSREEWERLHGDIAGTIGPEGTTDGSVGEGQSSWLDPEGVVGGPAGNRPAPRTPQEAARARRAAALAAFQADRQTLADALAGLGIDVATASNARIRKALEEAAKPGGKTFDQPVYHGGPHIFDRFSLDKIGTGEGAQAYGWGLYFASNKAIAEHYRRTLAGSAGALANVGFHPDGTPNRVGWVAQTLDANVPEADLPKLLAFLEPKWTPEQIEQTIAEGKTLYESAMKKGRLYHVEIPDDGAYLNWDKPLSEQSPEVRKALETIDFGGSPADIRKAIALYEPRTTLEGPRGEAARKEIARLRSQLAVVEDTWTGSEFYAKLARSLAAPDDVRGEFAARSDMVASLALRDAGVPGIQYLDGSSRSNGEGSHNYVLFDDSLASIMTYEQSARGSITFAENGAIIRLFQGRDLSTLIHESGHLWLAELEFDAKAPTASEDSKAMWQSVLDFVGSKDGYITVEQHELFARAFEAYTMEGKAPSEGLRAAFRSFKNWLVTIYRTLARLNAPLSPEMRQVFDRLLATDEEIAAALNTQGLNPLFADAKSAEMTEAEFKAYTANVTKVVDEAEQKVLTKVMAQIRREKTKELAAEKAKIRKEVTAELMADPGQGALHFLRNGKLYEGETPEVMLGKKLSRPDLVALIGEDGLKLLPKGVYAEEGLSPDDVAQQFGLGNGTELTERLIQIQAEQDAMRAKGDNRSVVNVRVAEETQRRLTESMGDPLNDGSIEAEAMAAVHSDKQAALMASELKVLARKAGHSGVISLDNIREWAKTAIGEMSTYQGTQFAKYQQAERVAGQKVQRALVKGDFMTAFKAKQDQLVNFALYQEAKKAADDTEKARKLADRYASARTIPNMDQEALDAIHEVLEEYDFKKRSGKLLAERTLFNAWAAEQAKAGHVVLEPPRLKGAQSKHFSQMTVDEIRGLHDAIAQMAHLGRLKKELIVNGEKRALDSLLTEMEDTAGKIAQRGVTQFREGETGLQEQLGDLRHTFTDMRTSFIKMERLLEILDGDKTGRGIFSQAIFKPIADSQNVHSDMLVEANKAIKAIYDKVPKDQRNKGWAVRHSVPDLQPGLTLTKEQIMALAMNVGNASNLDKVLQGRKWTKEGVMATLDKHLSKEEWTFVQDIWDHIDTYWAQIEALEKDVNGFAPKKVEATPVETKFGTFKGGYYPMEYNRHASFKADRIARMRETTAAVGELFAPGRAKPSTRAGSTHERVENFNAPVLLSLNVIHSHINEVTQDIAYRKAVMQVYKIIKHERFRGAVQAAVGPEYEGQILIWLQRIANEGVVDKVGMSGLDDIMRTLRLNVSIVGMGLRISTMLQQTVGYSNSIQRLGEAAMANGMRLFATSPKQMTETVFAKSGEMRNRANNLDRDMRANMKRFTGKEGIRPSVARFAFKGIALFDLGVTIPTWLGAYHQGLGQKMTEQEAVYYADKMVRDTQGAGGHKDLSALQNGSEAWKWFTMFGSYANVLYNAQLGLWTEARYSKMTPKLFASLMHQFLYLMILPPLLSALIVGKGPDDEEDWLLWAMRNVGFGAFQGIPIARDVASAAKNTVEGKFGGGGVNLTPVAGIGENLIRLGKDAGKLVQGEPVSNTALKNLFNTAGGVMGLPLGQPGLTLQYIVDVSTGAENPEDLWDWVRGLTVGPERKK
jgi:hypothetical protein